MRFAGLFTVVRQQIPNVGLSAKLQRQFPVGNISARAVEGGSIFRRLLLRSTKLESVAPLRPVVPEIMFMGSSSPSLRR